MCTNDSVACMSDLHVAANFLSVKPKSFDDGPKDSKSDYESDEPMDSVFGCIYKKLSVTVTFCTCFVWRR